jgi:hypothetical protein
MKKMNKHLRNIVEKYVSHKLPFLLELENYTKHIKRVLEKHVFYENYAIKTSYITAPDDPLRESEYPIGHKSYYKESLARVNNYWYVLVSR